MENIIAVTADNIDREYICCAISDKKGEACVSSKKAWMKERFTDDLVFRKLDVRGKVFPRAAAALPLSPQRKNVPFCPIRII